MGYTNYYAIKAHENNSFPIEFVNGVRLIVANSPCKIVGWDNEDLESKAEITEKRIALNGAGNEGYESFIMKPYETDFALCKTAREPYDVVVKAILLFAERKFSILQEKFSFDGNRNEKEFRRAVALLKKLKLY